LRGVETASAQQRRGLTVPDAQLDRRLGPVDQAEGPGRVPRGRVARRVVEALVEPCGGVDALDREVDDPAALVAEPDQVEAAAVDGERVGVEAMRAPLGSE